MEKVMKVVVSDPMSQKGLEVLEQAKGLKYDVKLGLSQEDLKQIIAEYDAIIIRSETKLKADVIEAGGHLRVIGRAGSGRDTVEIPAATKKGVVVLHTPP